MASSAISPYVARQTHCYPSLQYKKGDLINTNHSYRWIVNFLLQQFNQISFQQKHFKSLCKSFLSNSIKKYTHAYLIIFMQSPKYSNSPMNISHPITKLVHKYLLSHYHIESQNYTISIKSPNSFTLWAKPKKPNKTLQSPLLHGTLKPVAIRHSYKACCYMALLLSPLLHGNIFTKSQKVQIIFWHLFVKPK